MPNPRETEAREAGVNPLWLAFWSIVHAEVRRLEALEESRPASAEKA